MAHPSILDTAVSGTSATFVARKWESALLVNEDNDILRRVLDNPEAMAAVERREGWRSHRADESGRIRIPA